jgi:hypothetical protein
MNRRESETLKIRKAFLLLLPLIYFIISSYFRHLLGNLSLRSCDPEYIYFMSGLTMADGIIKVGHFDNPGTPLQLLVALVFRIVYFIRSAPVSFVEDVFTHPDLYLGIVSQTIAALTTLLLLYAGMKILRITGNIAYALLIHGVRYGREAYEHEHFDKQRITLCTSQDTTGNFHGRVTDYLKTQKIENNTHYFLCGNSEMIYEAFDILTTSNIPAENIYTEVYF